MTGVLGHGAADRATSAARALGRAEDATTAALQHLLRADDVDWAGPGAAGYRDELAAAVDAVRRVRARLREAEGAAAAHADAVRDLDQLAPAAGWPPGLPPLLTVPPLRLDRRQGTWTAP